MHYKLAFAVVLGYIFSTAAKEADLIIRLHFSSIQLWSWLPQYYVLWVLRSSITLCWGKEIQGLLLVFNLNPVSLLCFLFIYCRLMCWRITMACFIISSHTVDLRIQTPFKAETNLHIIFLLFQSYVYLCFLNARQVTSLYLIALRVSLCTLKVMLFCCFFLNLWMWK